MAFLIMVLTAFAWSSPKCSTHWLLKTFPHAIKWWENGDVSSTRTQKVQVCNKLNHRIGDYFEELYILPSWNFHFKNFIAASRGEILNLWKPKCFKLFSFGGKWSYVRWPVMIFSWSAKRKYEKSRRFWKQWITKMGIYKIWGPQEVSRRMYNLSQMFCSESLLDPPRNARGSGSCERPCNETWYWIKSRMVWQTDSKRKLGWYFRIDSWASWGQGNGKGKKNLENVVTQFKKAACVLGKFERKLEETLKSII